MDEVSGRVGGAHQAGRDFQPPQTVVPSRVMGTPQHCAKAEAADDSDGEVRGGGWGAQAKAGLPPGPSPLPLPRTTNATSGLSITAMPRALHRAVPH